MSHTLPVDSKGAEHEHKFVIPVEWEPLSYMRTFGGRDYSKPIKFTVTKLRCECGKEAERPTNE